MSTEELPDHWAESSLGDIAHKLVDGSHNPPPKQSSGLPMLSAVNINRNTIDFTENFRLIDEAAFAEEDRRTAVVPGDILLTIVGAIGRAAVVPAHIDKFTLQRSVAVIGPALVDSKFLCYQFEASQLARYLTDNARGTAQKGVYLKTLAKAKVHLAPLREQRRIVAKIEELFSELDKGVEALTTAREQLKVYCKTLLDQAASGDLLVAHGVQKGRFNEDTWRSLSEVVSSLGQGWSPRCLNHPSSSEELWAVITTTAIQHGSFGDQENKQLPDELEPRTHLVIQPGDILVTRAGPRKRVGVACLVRRSRPRLLVCDKAYRLRVKEKELLPEWMELILNSPRILQSVEELKTGISDSGVNLTQDRFLGLRVPVPSLKAQRETLSIVDAATSHATNLAGQIDSALIQIDALRQSILKQAFSGQLVAQDPADEPASVLLERIRVERNKADAKKPGRKTKITGNRKTGKRATA